MLDTFVERQTRTLRGNIVLIGLRLLLATVSLAVLLIEDSRAVLLASSHHAEPPFYFQAPGLVATIVCGLTIVYLLVARRSSAVPALAPKLAFVQIFVDVLLISALIWHTGGANSQFIVLYLISICSAAFVLKWNVSLMAAAAASTLFSTVTLLYSLGIVPQQLLSQAGLHLEKLRNLGLLDAVRLLLLPVCAFFLSGYLAGSLARRLASARFLHQEILEGIGEGILVVDTERRAVYHNQAFQRLLSARKSINGALLSELLGENLDRQVQDALRCNKAARSEVILRRVDSTHTPFLVRITPLSELDGGVARNVILAMDDISAEKKMEEFQKHRQRLETMGHISATIAHEIRNPLASIRGAVQEIGRAVTIPDNKKILLDIVLSESDRLDQIITEFLRFARMRPPRFQATDMGRVLMDVRLLLASRPEAKGVNITVSGDEGEPFPADPEQLRQLFLNLGLNALQAMDGPRKELQLRVKRAPLHQVQGFEMPQLLERVNRPGVLIEVQDSGQGMSPAVFRQIFEPFFTTKACGTGLGLAIVERIVQAHEGLVTVESKEGQGTTFRLWLPTDLRMLAAVSGHQTATV